MSVKIDNSHMYTKSQENCRRCGQPLNIGTVLHNRIENCKDRITFPYMDIGESMHLECYIEHVIDTHLKKRLED
jgi:hypothetical protein